MRLLKNFRGNSLYSSRDCHISFGFMDLSILSATSLESNFFAGHSRVRATKDAGIAAFGKNKREGQSGSGSGGGGGGGGDGVSGWPNAACRQPPPVQDDSSDSSSDED